MDSNRKRSISNINREEYLRAVVELSEEIFHDFKNTLATISGISQLTTYQELPQDVKENMELINKATLEAKEQIDRFYNFVKGYNVDTRQYEPLSNIVFTCLDLIKHRVCKLGADHILLSVNILSTGEIFCNEYKMRQAILNILMNAIDAMEEKGGVVKINLFDRLNTIVLEIIDTGIGIDKDNLERIFETNFTTKGEKGTGLGLKISKSVIESCGGKIEVKSELGKGTIFTISFPILNF